MKILKFKKFETNFYSREYPLNRQQIGVNAEDVANNSDFARKENVFQEVQDQMKILLKPIILRKNPNADDSDIEKVSNSFFSLGNNKNQEIRRMVDGCKDTRKCAKDIIDKYLKYVKINFGAKDDINDVEQDSVMTNEGKLSDAEHFGNYIKYHNEIFPGFNIPKRYMGKGKYTHRVLAREGDKVKPINFGNLKSKPKPLNRLDKRFWDLKLAYPAKTTPNTLSYYK